MNKPLDSLTLVKLGLSPNEATCYLKLLENSASSAADLAKHMKILPNAVYRLLDNLERSGMVVSLATSPKKHQALPPQAAIEAFAKQQAKALDEAKVQAINALSNRGSGPGTTIDFITGSHQFFTQFVELSTTAKEEILVISIGEPVSDEVKLATRDALARGVKVKFMFHKYDAQNQALLYAWAAMGVSVAHYPDSGFHLLVFDGQKAVLVASNPKEPKERTGMVITSPSLASALRDFFYARWEKALLIKP